MKLSDVAALVQGQRVQLQNGLVVTVGSQDATKQQGQPAIPFGIPISIGVPSNGRVLLQFDDGTIGILNWEDARQIDLA
jgi:hypothetical protein